MKKRILVAWIISAALPLMLHAQNKKRDNCGCSFSSINQLGMLEGGTGTAFQFQTVNGLRYNKFFAGIGIGYDRYRLRSVPVFLDLRMDFFRRANTPFVYGDIGWNEPWPEDRDKSEWLESDFKGGVYYDAGLGYRWGFGKKHGVVFSGGFSFKHLREDRTVRTWCDFPPFCTSSTSTERYDFKLRRFSIKAGIQL